MDSGSGGSPALTIVTINLNDADGLERTLRSIAAQTAVAGVQSVVVDGGSTDDSPTIIARYRQKLSATVVQEKDRGIYDAMNKGLVLAQGRYTLWLNAGDFLVDERVVADFLEHVAARDGTPRVVMGDLVEESAGGASRELRPYTFSRHLLGLSMHRHPSSFVPTALARAVGGYSEEYGFAGDFDFMLRLSFAVGVEEWRRTCAVFAAGGVSEVNATRIPAVLARVRRERLQPSFPLRTLLTLYDGAYRLNYRRHLRKRGRRV